MTLFLFFKILQFLNLVLPTDDEWRSSNFWAVVNFVKATEHYKWKKKKKKKITEVASSPIDAKCQNWLGTTKYNKLPFFKCLQSKF